MCQDPKVDCSSRSRTSHWSVVHSKYSSNWGAWIMDSSLVLKQPSPPLRTVVELRLVTKTDERAWIQF